jgi:uncharacterized membrane protein
MDKRAVAAIAVALLAMVGVWMYGQRLANDVAIQRLSASATAIAAIGGLLAFVALVVYTVETAKLRQVAQQQMAVAQEQVREAQIQNETAVRPILGFDVAERKLVQWINVETTEEMAEKVSDAFVMRNLGLGPAFNIRTKCDCDDVQLDVTPTILGQGQTVPVGVVAFSETPEQRTLASISRILPIFQNGKLPERLELTFTCESTNRTQHKSCFALVYNPETDGVWIEFLAAQ